MDEIKTPEELNNPGKSVAWPFLKTGQRLGNNLKSGFVRGHGNIF
jgi:hypothetical protein